MMTTVTGKVSTRLGDFARGDRRSPGMIISLPGTGIALIRKHQPAIPYGFPGEHSSIGKKVKVKDRSESGLPGNFARVGPRLVIFTGNP